MRIPFCAALLGLLAPIVQSAYAGQPIVMDDKAGKKVVQTEDDFPYTAGTKEFIFGVATHGSIGTKDTAKRPDGGYVIGELKLGVMLTTPRSTGFLRGNLEVLGEAFGGDIFAGPGDILAGGQLLFRYNFVQPHARFVPFIQVGGGGVWSDAAYVDRIQHNIGSNWSFVLSAEIGGRIHLSRNCALELGLEYRHISNADTASRNQGLNTLGGEIGINYFF